MGGNAGGKTAINHHHQQQITSKSFLENVHTLKHAMLVCHIILISSPVLTEWRTSHGPGSVLTYKT